MEVPALQAEDYFTDEDYLPPRSPGLQPVKIRWYSNGIDSISGTKRGRIYDLSVDDDELDLVGILHPEISIDKAGAFGLTR
jgi:hypothetical protein